MQHVGGFMKKSNFGLMAIISLVIIGCAAAEPRTSHANPSVHVTQVLSGNWKIAALYGEAIEQNLRTANIKFENGRASGTGFCNNYGGEIKGQMPYISFGPIMATKMACMENMLMEQEAKFHAMLGEVRSALQNGNDLTLKNQSGEVIAVFKKSNN